MKQIASGIVFGLALCLMGVAWAAPPPPESPPESPPEAPPEIASPKAPPEAPPEAVPADDGPRVCAIFVKNRAGKTLGGQGPVFEDLLVGELDAGKYSVISTEETAGAVAGLAGEGGEGGEGGDGTDNELDTLLADSTTAIRLAQNLGADYLLVASLLPPAQSTRRFSGNGVETTVVETRQRVAYKLLSGATGRSLASGNALATHKQRQTAGLSVEEDVTDLLLADAASQIARQLDTAARVPRDQQQEYVTFSVVCTMQDLGVPDIVRADNGQDWQVAPGALPVEGLDVIVELDGLAVGSAPGTFQATRGLHRIRLTREGFVPVERNIGAREGLELRVAMQMDEPTLARWQEQTRFLQDLKSDQKLTDAQTEQIRGIAQFFRQSGYKVDVGVEDKTTRDVNIDHDVKIDTDQAPVLQMNQSLWGTTVPGLARPPAVAPTPGSAPGSAPGSSPKK